MPVYKPSSMATTEAQPEPNGDEPEDDDGDDDDEFLIASA